MREVLEPMTGVPSERREEDLTERMAVNQADWGMPRASRWPKA